MLGGRCGGRVARLGYRSRHDSFGRRKHRVVRRIVHVHETEIGMEYLGGGRGRCRPPRHGVDRRGGIGDGSGGDVVGICLVLVAISPLFRLEFHV